jgi:hypothetical protein
LGKGLATRSFTSAATTISGGTLEVTSGADGGHVIFSSGGILQLDALMAFGGTISGFTLGDAIDLRGLAYTSGTTNLSWTQLTSGANASGTLTVSSGAAVETALAQSQQNSDKTGHSKLKNRSQSTCESVSVRGDKICREKGGASQRPGGIFAPSVRPHRQQTVCPSLKRRLTIDVTARVTRIGRAEPQTRRVSRGRA